MRATQHRAPAPAIAAANLARSPARTSPATLLLVLVLAGVGAACTAPAPDPMTTTPGQKPSPSASEAPARDVPARDAPAHDAPIKAPPSDAPRKALAPGVEPPPASLQRDRPAARQEPDGLQPGGIDTAGGVTIGQIVAANCPDGGGAPFARWVSGDKGLDGRLVEAGVAPDIRQQVAGWDQAGAGVLLVHGGAAPNPGHRLVIESINRPATGPLQVRGRMVAPAPGSMQAQVLVYPCQLIQVTDPGRERDSSVDLSLGR